MAAGALNIEIEQGATFRRLLTWTNADGGLVNLAGYTGKLQIRQKKGAVTVLFEMTTENGGLVLGGAAGTIELVISAADTGGFKWTNAVYDLLMVDVGGEKTRLIEGEITIDHAVTLP